MLSVVIDTNVIVSAIISPTSSPGQIMELTMGGKLRFYYSVNIMDEYEDVLFRPKFNFNPRTVSQLLDFIVDYGHFVNPTPSAIILPDESDRIFYDAAKTTNSYLITGNIKHYPIEPHIVKPTDFLREL